MKYCPQCGRTQADDDEYCFDDGAPLLFRQDVGSTGRSAEIPTQIVSSFQTPPAQTVPNRSNSTPWWVLVLIGSLAATTLVFGVIFFFDKNDRRNTENSVSGFVNTSAEPSSEGSLNQDGPSHAVVNISRTPAQPSTVDTSTVQNEITARLEQWASDGESKDANAVLMNYAPMVSYYRKGNASREFIARDKSRAYSRFSSIDITLSNIYITPDQSGTSATAVLDKAFVFSGGGYLDGKVRQELKFVKINGQWLINGERDLKVYYMRK